MELLSKNAGAGMDLWEKQAAKRMAQTMSKGLYSMSTVVKGERLGQFLDTEMPSMNKLKVCIW